MFLPPVSCPEVQKFHKNAVNSPAMLEILQNPTYSGTIELIRKNLNLAADVSPLEIVMYIDGIYSRFLNGKDVAPFTATDIPQILDLYDATIYQTIASNDTIRGLTATGILDSVVSSFDAHVNKAPKGQHKYFLYVDGDDSFYSLRGGAIRDWTEKGNHYTQYASSLIIELYS